MLVQKIFNNGNEKKIESLLVLHNNKGKQILIERPDNTFADIHKFIGIVYYLGYTIAMPNFRRWSLSYNDNIFMTTNTPFHEAELRGNKSTYVSYTDLEVACAAMCYFYDELIELNKKDSNG